MARFHNPTPVELDVPMGESSTEEVKGVDIMIEDDTSEELETESPTEELEITPDVEITLDEEKPEENENEYANNPYLLTINTLIDKGLFDAENVYEGFDESTEPSEEVLEKFIAHNMEIRERKALEEFLDSVSPLTQRILQYDLDSKGQSLDFFLKTLIEESNIKSLDPTNEYDREKIVRMWYKDEDFTGEEIEEKIQDLKTAGLLEKEANRLKPKLDARAEAIAKQQEESQRNLAQIENQRRQIFYSRVEDEIKSGKIDDIPVSKEDATKIIQLLLAEEVTVKAGGREMKMSALEAEVFKHKYSNNGDIKLLLKTAYLLTNPDKFYKYYAEKATTKEVNNFITNHKYGIKKSVQQPADKKVVPWNRPN